MRASTLLGLVGQRLGALAQRVQRLVLRASRVAQILAAQRVLRVTHRLARLAQFLRRLSVHALERILQFLFQVVLLFLQALGAAILGIGLALLLAEGLVQQRALLARQIAEFLQFLVQRLVLGALSALAALGHAHVFQHGLQHRQKLGGFLPLTGLG